MKTIILLFSISIFGLIGWWIGAHVGLMTAYLISFVGNLTGVVIGVKISQRYLG